MQNLLAAMQRHPFAVNAHFDHSLVLAYAVKPEEVQHLLPEPLELDLYQDRWAFIAVAMVQTRKLRPEFFPKMLGRDFMLTGYRLFVRYRGKDNRRRRGLCILRSETDNRCMTIAGNQFTKYRYSYKDIRWKVSDDGVHEIATNRGFHVRARCGNPNMPLPEGSPFENWREARLFSGPMPFTFSYDQNENLMTTVEGVRTVWKPEPIEVEEAQIPFLKELGLEDAQLANAFIVNNVDYHWKRGVTEPCK